MGEVIASDRTADRLLLLLKNHGRSTTSSLARRLKISVPGARQHLMRLREEGLVSADATPSGVGRPAQRWELTQEGHRRFPDTHAETLASVLRQIRSTLGEAALDRVIAARGEETERVYRAHLAKRRSLEARLEALTELRREEGYMAELSRDDDGWVLAENHCPICAAAQTCQGFCRSELALFRALLAPAEVTRVEYLLDGARRCAYRVRRAGKRDSPNAD
jgi:predicted ArsR family transcriptional regulator